MAAILQIGTEVDTSGLAALNAAAAETATVLEELAAEFKKVELSSREAAAESALSFAEMKEAGKSALEGISSAATSASGGLATLGAALGAAAVVELVEHMKEAALEVSHLSEATGIGVKDLTSLKDAMEAAGVPTERLPLQMTQLASAMEAAADGSQKQVDAFAALGINTSNWANKMPDALSVLNQLADHAKESSNSVRDLAAMKALLGRNAVALAAFLKQGSEAIQEEESHFRAHAEAMDQNVENALKLQRAEAEFKATLETALAPILKYVVDLFTGLSIITVFVKAGWNDLIAIGKLLGTVISEQATEFDRLIHLDFKGYVAAQQRGLEEVKKAWIETKQTIVTQADEAEKEAGEIFARSNQKIRRPEEGGGPSGPLKRPGASLQEELDVQKRLGEERVKLAEDQAKYQAQVTGEADKLSLAESAVALSKTLEDKKAQVAQLATILEEQARQEKDAALTAATGKEEVDSAYIRKSLALHTSSSEADKKERAKLNGELELLELQHQDEMTRIATQFESRLAAARQRVANENAKIAQEEASRDQKMQAEILKGREADIDGQMKVLEEGTKREASALAQAAKLHTITAQQEHDMVVQLYADEYDKRVALLRQKELLFIQEAQAQAAAEGKTLSDSQAKLLPGYQKLYQQELEDYQQFLNQKQKADEAAQQKLQQDSEKTAQTLATGYDQMFLHAKNFHDAVANVWGDLQKTFEQAVTHMIAAWITSLLEGKAVSAETALGQVLNNAYVAASNVWTATSAIPIIGPALAPVAAAAAFTAVAAFGGGIGSAEQGAVLPQDMLILAHRNEMILPPTLSRGVQEAITGSQGAGVGGGAGMVYAPTIQAVDGASVKRVLDDNKPVVASSFQRLLKAGLVSQRHVKV